MKREDILKIAYKHGLLKPHTIKETLLDFAAEIAEAEREECAGLCDRFAARDMHPKECADAIRARCEK